MEICTDKEGQQAYDDIELRNRLSAMESEIQRLQESEARYRTMFKTAGDAIVTLKEGRICEYNPAALKLFRCKKEELVGEFPTPFSITFQPDGRDSQESSAEKINLALKGEPQFFEWRHKRFDGTPFDAEVSLNRIDDKLVQGIIRDVTGRKLTEAALKKGEDRLRAIFEAADDASFIVTDLYTTEPRILDFSPGSERIFGYRREEIIGKPVGVLHQEEEIKIFPKIIKEMRRTRKKIKRESILVRKSGEKFPAAFTLYPLFDEDGRMNATLGISIDISERRCAEDALKRAYDDLEKRIRDRTAELVKTNRKLEIEICERKKAEEIIRTSETKYRALFENSRDAIYLRDRNGNLLDVNQAMEDLFGYSREELIGMNVRDHRVVPSDMDKFQEELETNGSVRAYEERLLKKDGTEIICQITSTVGATGGRTPPMYHGIIRDITERKCSEAALRQSEEKFRLLFEKSPAAKLLLDDGEVLNCNQAAVEIMGCLQNSQLLGLHTADLSPVRQPDGRLSSEKASEIRSTAFKQGSLRFEWVFQRMDGSKFFAEVTLISIPLNGMRILYSVFNDISQRKRAEENLKRSEKQLAEIINFLPDATWAIDAKGTVTVWNRGAEAMTGTRSEDMLGRGNYEYALPLYGERRPLLLDLVLLPSHETERKYDFIKRKGPTLIGEGEAPFPGMTKRYLWGKASAIYNSNGEIVGAIESVRDITAQKRAEQEKKRLESQLLHAQKMEAMGVLAGGIAHDFNNILTGLLGFAELSLYDIPEDGKARYSINQILKAGSRAKDLVKQILSFSRQTEQEKQPVRVNLIVKETLKLMRASLPRTITIRQEITPKEDMVLADPTQLHQVLMNLCTNAHHAMLEKGGVLGITLHSVELDEKEVSAHQDLKPGHYLKLTVRDTGHGMDKHTIKMIFDPYFTTKPKEVGTGLGLSVVHGIVRDHGGAILAQSEKGKGSSFTVFLPAIEIKQEVNPEIFKPIPRGTERILFVDDEKVIADLGIRIIGHLGYRVTAMTSSIAAIKAVLAKPYQYDMVITDMTMPGMTGEALAGKILEIRPDIPIILCTGFSELISEERAKRMGIRAFVMKPFSMRGLGKVIRLVLDERPPLLSDTEQ